MTLYRELGSISFECQTQHLQIFSASNSTLIIQFKNYQQIELDQIRQILSVYGLILKNDSLLEIYSERNKPACILLHKSQRVGFEKITIQFMCKIIKEMIVSIVHSGKIASDKIGEISKQMFFQIDGQLRYIYLPTYYTQNRQQKLIEQILTFLDQIKQQKQVSHRLLLKKISKCQTLEQILEETQYFMNIYYAKQVQPAIPINNYVAPKDPRQTYLGKPLKKSKSFNNKLLNQNIFTENRFKHEGFGLNLESCKNNKITRNRKHYLFKNADATKSKTPIYPSGYSSSTWRKPLKENIPQSGTFRVNSKAVHVDLNKNFTKTLSTSLFNRASSVTASPKKQNSRKRQIHESLHHDYLNEQKRRWRVEQQNINKSFINKSSISQKLDQQENGFQKSKQKQSNLLSKEKKEFQNKKLSTSSIGNSAYMKQMVNNSLQKWKLKQNSKNHLIKAIKTYDKQGQSTNFDSRSKLVEKNVKNQQDLKSSNVSNKKMLNHYDIINQQTFSTNAPRSQKKLKRKFHIQGQERLSVVESEIFQKSHVVGIHSNQDYFNQIAQIQKPELPQQQQSLEQINFNLSSIDQISMKNRFLQQEQKNRKKHLIQQNQIIQQIKQNEKILKTNNQKHDRKKTSIKDIQIKSTKKITDQSETERIQYSQSSKQKLNSKQSQKQNKQLHKLKQQTAANNLWGTKLQALYKEKDQFDYLGVAVVQTNDHLKSYQSIFWQLPMFFVYKRFYQRRLKLHQKTRQLLSKYSQQIKIIQLCQSLSEQNLSIEQSLKRLLKTVKKKIKKAYSSKSQQQYIQKFIHLDYTINYDNVIDQFLLLYLASLMQAKKQFPQLIIHIVEIYQAVFVDKGGYVDATKRQIIFDDNQDKQTKLNNIQAYYAQLCKEKAIKKFKQPECVKSTKPKTKK